MPLEDEQRQFAAALADSTLAPPAGSAHRFGVHRNNVRVGIAAVLAARFPVVKRLVGDDYFTGMAAAYVQAEPPMSSILMFYGGGFANFIAGFEPAADVPYLSDVAQLEWQLHEASNAADSESIGAVELAGVPPSAVPGLILHLHPSIRLFSSAFPALTIWELNTNPGDVEAQKLAATAEYVLLLRPRLDVEIRRVSPAFHSFCATLQSAAPFAAAVEAALARDDHFDVRQSLAGLISMGALTGYDHCAN